MYNFKHIKDNKYSYFLTIKSGNVIVDNVYVEVIYDDAINLRLNIHKFIFDKYNIEFKAFSISYTLETLIYQEHYFDIISTYHITNYNNFKKLIRKSKIKQFI